MASMSPLTRDRTMKCVVSPSYLTTLKNPLVVVIHINRPCLAAAAFNFQPAITAVQALAYRWAWLRWHAIAFHADRPCFRLGTVRRTGRLPSLLAGSFGAYLCAHDLATPDDLA